jgi:hypothetical protein
MPENQPFFRHYAEILALRIKEVNLRFFEEKNDRRTSFKGQGIRAKTKKGQELAFEALKRSGISCASTTRS